MSIEDFFNMLKALNLDFPTAMVYAVTLYICVALFKYFLERFINSYENSLTVSDRIIDILCDLKEILELNEQGGGNNSLIFRKKVELGKLLNREQYNKIVEILSDQNAIEEISKLIESNLNYRGNTLSSDSSFSNQFEKFLRESHLGIVFKSICGTIGVVYISLFWIITILDTKGKPLLEQVEDFAGLGIILSFSMCGIIAIDSIIKYAKKNKILIIFETALFTGGAPFAFIWYFENSNNMYDGILFVIVDFIYIFIVIKLLKKLRITSSSREIA